MAALSLEQRIATALSATDIKSADLVKLLGEVETAIVDADKAAEEARTTALDPALSPDPEAARQNMQAAGFARDRLKTLQPRLQLRCRDVQEAERLAAWHRDFERVRPLHAAAVARFTRRYPKLVAELADLMHDMAEVDALVSRVLIARPTGVRDHLDKVEVAARGRLLQPDVSIPLQLRLPYFDRCNGSLPVYAWPPQQTIDPSLFAPVPFNPLYSADWQDALAKRDQQRREEAARLDAYYEQRECEAEQRCEAELREAREGA